VIEFRNVDFSIEGRPIVADVSFNVPRGQTRVILGPSGSGKSTIIGLITAFHTPNAGVVTVDGVDLSTVRLDSFRTQLGVVLQDSFLFAGTIRENVAFSRPEATDAQIREACRIARVDEFADRFPEGLDTVVGERGVKLSGGQRQRIAIARVLLKDAPILILDEATSALDSESERTVSLALSRIPRQTTMLIVAHRLSTVKDCDRIVVLDKGKVVGHDSHPNLVRDCALYRRFVELGDLALDELESGLGPQAAPR